MLKLKPGYASFWLMLMLMVISPICQSAQA